MNDPKNRIVGMNGEAENQVNEVMKVAESMSPKAKFFAVIQHGITASKINPEEAVAVLAFVQADILHGMIAQRNAASKQ